MDPWVSMGGAVLGALIPCVSFIFAASKGWAVIQERVSALRDELKEMHELFREIRESVQAFNLEMEQRVTALETRVHSAKNTLAIVDSRLRDIERGHR